MVVETGQIPFLTNGDWDESLQSVTFRSRIYPPKDRQLMAPVVFHASWSVPNRDAQENIFGRVALSRQGLAEYCLWETTLEDADRDEWFNLLGRAARTGDVAELRSFLERVDGQGRNSRPPPASLREACAP